MVKIDPLFMEIRLNEVCDTRNKVRTQKINPHPLFLIDSTVNHCIDQVVSLPMQFSCGLLCVVECYVMPLDSSCEVVLGYNWLRMYNPTINWSGNTLTLPNRPPAKPLVPLVPSPVAPAKTPPLTNKPHISPINTATYQRACQTEGAISFQLHLLGCKTPTGRVSHIGKEVLDLDKVPAEYHQYIVVFSKEKLKQLPPHCPYDLSIQLENKSTPPPRANLLSIYTRT